MGLRETLGDQVVIRAATAESRRFGISITNVVVGSRVVESEALETLSALLRISDTHYHIRCNMAHRRILAFLHQASDHQVFVADPLMYWNINLKHGSATTHSDQQQATPNLDRLGPSDIDFISASVAQIFSGYITHWHYIPRTHHLRAEEAYSEWMISTLQDLNSQIYAYSEGSPCGFLAAHIDDDYTDILLAGVVPEVQGAGAYKRMLTEFLTLARNSGLDVMNISTQSDNIRVQRVWATLGFKPFQSTAIVHLVPKADIG